jgi:hypothetical protein
MSAGQVVKKIVSCLAVLAGLLLVVVSFGLLGVEPLVGSYSLKWETCLSSVTLFFMGSAALAASWIAFRNRKAASLLYLIAAPLVSLGVWASKYPLVDVFSDSGHQHPLSASIAVVLVLLLLLGYFWSIAHRYHWPQIAFKAGLPVWAKRAFLVSAICFFCVCICATSVHFASSWEFPGDCGLPSPFSKTRPDHAVFIARVVHVDTFTGAMAIVEQRFGGLHWWNKIVFLKFIPEKATWFVDGRLEDGIVNRWIVPVLDLKCTRSSRVQDAGVELRLLRDSPDWDGVRIIGRIIQAPRKGWWPAAGAAVTIIGPYGSVDAVTDGDGIYDVSGMPPGHYSIRVPASRRDRSCQDRTQEGLKSGDVWGCELFLYSE